MSYLSTENSLRRFQIAGYASIFLMIGVAGGWAAIANINGAVIAPATVIVESNTKRVQSRDGGIVREILAKDGDRVQEGQTLAIFDDTETKAELAIIDALLDEALAKSARLEAERDDLPEVVFPEELLSRKGDRIVDKLIVSQQKYFAARMATVRGKVDQLRQQIAQISKQIAGINSQIDSKQSQADYIAEELVGLTTLKEKGLVSNSRYLAMQRERARLEGESGELAATRAGAETKIGEVKLVILQTKEEALSQTLGELRETEARIAELRQRKIAAAAKLERTIVKSPIAGDVYQLAVHTEGGVIGPGENLMLVVPQGMDLVLQAQVMPQNIDQVSVGQKARVRLTAFNARVTPEIGAEVTHVAADVSQTNAQTPPFYMVTLKIPKDQLALLEGQKLKPGMQAEAFIQTGARSPLSFLIKPLRDQIEHAWRER